MVTQITELLKIKLPIIQAPMAGGVTTPELVAAVSNAGGLGSLAAGYLTAAEIAKTIKQIRRLTSNPFAVNLFVPEKYHATVEQIERAKKVVQTASAELNYKVGDIKPPYTPSFEEQMKVVFDAKVPIISFTFGIPSAVWQEKLIKNNIKLIGTATTLAEAKMLEKNNMDCVVAQGSEAGGHRGSFLSKDKDNLLSRSSLVETLTSHIKIPVVAAGGIMNANEIAASLTLGAVAVQMGTAFLCCSESGAHPIYKNALLNMSDDNTTLTRAFSGKWARGINNKFIMRMRSHEADILDYPIQHVLTSGIRKESANQHCVDFMSMWAGQAAYLCEALSVAVLIQKLLW